MLRPLEDLRNDVYIVDYMPITTSAGTHYDWFKYNNGIMEMFGSYVNLTMSTMNLIFPWSFININYSIQLQEYLEGSSRDEWVIPTVASKKVDRVDLVFIGALVPRFDMHIKGLWKNVEKKSLQNFKSCI